jgi:hypothetical protein
LRREEVLKAETTAGQNKSRVFVHFCVLIAADCKQFMNLYYKVCYVWKNVENEDKETKV